MGLRRLTQICLPRSTQRLSVFASFKKKKTLVTAMRVNKTCTLISTVVLSFEKVLMVTTLVVSASEHKIVKCPTGKCGDHGACNDTTGKCECHDDYTGMFCQKGEDIILKFINL